MNYVSEAELMERIKVSRYAVWQLRREGLPHLKIRGRIRYDLTEAEAWIKEHCKGQSR